MCYTGARRLHTVLERILEEVSFDAPDLEEKHVVITKEYVQGEKAPYDSELSLCPASEGGVSSLPVLYIALNRSTHGR